MPTPEFREVTGARDIAHELAHLLQHRSGHWGLTGGRTGIAVLRALRDQAHEIPWGQWTVWWGDERYLPSDDPDRNDVQAQEALLAHLPLPPNRIHRWLAPDESRDDPDVSAHDYASALQRYAPEGMDLLLLGVGPDGHVASLFPPFVPNGALPGSPITAAVRDSPKPPRVRTTFTMKEICRAREVWLFVLGKPDIAAALQARDLALPAAHVQAREKTVIWIDSESAQGLHPA